MAKIKIRTIQYFNFYCPACKRLHTVSDAGGWNVTGDLNRPTITPSVLNRTPYLTKEIVDGEIIEKMEYKDICHLTLTDGMIDYCPDCEHEMAGKTIELPDLK